MWRPPRPLRHLPPCPLGHQEMLGALRSRLELSGSPGHQRANLVYCVIVLDRGLQVGQFCYFSRLMQELMVGLTEVYGLVIYEVMGACYIDYSIFYSFYILCYIIQLSYHKQDGTQQQKAISHLLTKLRLNLSISFLYTHGVLREQTSRTMVCICDTCLVVLAIRFLAVSP